MTLNVASSFSERTQNRKISTDYSEILSRHLEFLFCAGNQVVSVQVHSVLEFHMKLGISEITTARHYICDSSVLGGEVSLALVRSLTASLLLFLDASFPQ